MTCKPESQKQRLERIAVQILAGITANPDSEYVYLAHPEAAKFAIAQAQELIKQLDALPIDE